MIIIVNCPGCSERYEVDGALAGKKSRCKLCKEVFRIPVPTVVTRAESQAPDRARAASPRPIDDPRTAGKPPRAPASRPQAETSVWDPIFDDESDWRKPPTPKPSHAVDHDFHAPKSPVPERAGYRNAPERESLDIHKNAQWSSKVGRWYMALTVPAVLIAAIYASAFGTEHKVLVVIGSFYLMSMLIAGIVLAVTSQFWSIAQAFHESPMHGLMFLFVPLYDLYYTITRWRRTRAPFLLRAYLAVTFLMSFGIFAVFTIAFGNRVQPGAAIAQGGMVNAAPDPAIPPDANPMPPAEEMPNRRPPFAFNEGRIGAIHSDAEELRLEAERQRKSLRDDFGDRCVTINIVGLPTNDDPSQGVTPQDVAQDLTRRFQSIMAGAGSTLMTSTLDKIELLLAPVDDPQSIASRIDFGTVTVKGNRIQVRLDPAYIAAVPKAAPRVAIHRPDMPAHTAPMTYPPGADSIDRSMIDLGSTDQWLRRQAVERLERATPDHRHEQVTRALTKLLDDDDGFLVTAAIKALAAWRAADAVPAIIGRTADNRINVRWEAISALGTMRDPRAIDALVSRLGEDGFQAEPALIKFGPAAEGAVIGCLRSPEPDLRRKACNILKQIGGLETLKAMQSLPLDPDLSVRMAANQASMLITARVGPPPAGSRSPLLVPAGPKGKR